jgi:alanyl-tRNA synthetase
VICLAAIQNDKISIVVALTPDCEGEHDAVGLVRIAADAIGGMGGGGRFDMAQAGGNEPENANAALESVREALAQ